uniref:Uncharacterized protein n=1 Tax=Glossina palpalis gambiensis TaxID=67801 RepID=A0A1B0BSE4_9MUSC
MKFVEQMGVLIFPLRELVMGYKYLSNYHKFTFYQLKQDPCHGQRIRPSPKTPFTSGALAYTAMILCNLIIANDSKFIVNTIDGRIGDVTAYRCVMTRYEYLENLCNDLDRMQRAIKDAEKVITLMKEEIALKKLEKAEAIIRVLIHCIEAEKL